MKKKNFSRLLLTGKVASMPFIPSANAALSPFDLITTSSAIYLSEKAETGINVLETDSAITFDGVSANIIHPGSGCTNVVPTEMTVVVSGLLSGDTVWIAAADDKDDPGLLGISPSFRIGFENLEVLSKFDVHVNTQREVGFDAPPGSAMMDQNVLTFSVPIDLSKFTSSSDNFYLQAMVARADGTLKFSDLDYITRVETDACSYGGEGSLSGTGTSTY
ncbi:MAG: hypothetical protein HN842_11915 [Gammaproteobacteria bacterium]|jgi:hypothetical protein|nr:hypothetical protein [Gammaproteobacteria bacterium]MBT7308915.1 hypothetical protein [Gammaproteobacteria bacterium]